MSRKFAPPAARLTIGHRAREAGSAPLSIGAREPEEPAPRFHRDRAGADSGYRQLFPKRCARRIQRCDRRPAARRIQGQQSGGDRRPQRLPGISQDGPVAAFRRAISGSAPRPIARSCCTTRWWIFPLDRLLEIGRQDLRHNQDEFKRVAALVDKSRTAEQILNETLLDHPAAGQAAAELSRRAGRTARLHPDETNRDDPVESAADCGGNAALHARADHRLDGHAGTVREGRKGGILQRHAAREDVGR